MEITTHIQLRLFIPQLVRCIAQLKEAANPKGSIIYTLTNTSSTTVNYLRQPSKERYVIRDGVFPGLKNKANPSQWTDHSNILVSPSAGNANNTVCVCVCSVTRAELYHIGACSQAPRTAAPVDYKTGRERKYGELGHREALRWKILLSRRLWSI